MFILAYRDEDANSISDLISHLQSDDKVLNIGIKNLELDDINHLVSSLIGSSSKADNEALSKVFKAKTGGNPFHLLQIIHVAQVEGLLSFNGETKFWEFDVDTIRTEIMVSETLAALLTKKIRGLPYEIQESLKIASLFGFQFREDMVAEVKAFLDDQQLDGQKTTPNLGACTISSSTVSTSLSEALKSGFIEKCAYGYHFSHDKLQAAFQSLLGKDETSQIHKIIGEIYVANGDPESIYHAVNHLHLCENYTMNINNHVEFARMHLIAANFCRERSAFIQAADLLRHGLALLGDEKWENNFCLAFQFTESLAKMELIIGNFDSCSLLTKICLKRAKSKDLKIDSLVTNVECCMARNDVSASILAANQALHELGVIMPAKTSFYHVATKFTKVKWMIGRKTNEEILKLPIMTDKLLSTIVRLLVSLCMYCFLRDEESQGAYAALLATEITLKNGLGSYSSAAFAIYGVAELSNGFYSRAYRFGKLALDMLQHTDSSAAEAYTKGLAITLLTHWYDPLNDVQFALRKAAQNGFHVGDVVNGSFCLGMSYAVEITLGTNLEHLEVIMRENDAKIRQYSESMLLMWAQPSIQYVLNLRTTERQNWREVVILDGEFMNEHIFIPQIIEAKHLTLWSIVLTYKCILAASFGLWSEALSIFRETININDCVHYTFGALALYFFGSLSSYSLYGMNRKKKYLRIARKWRAAYVKGHRRGNKNTLSYMTLLDAEDLSVKKSTAYPKVIESYEKAIKAANLQGVSHQKALANERKALFLARLGKFEEAENHFNRSIQIYETEWGSPVTCEWLKEKRDQLLKPHMPGKSAFVGSFLDFNEM
jgi:predicted ATPase